MEEQDSEQERINPCETPEWEMYRYERFLAYGE